MRRTVVALLVLTFLAGIPRATGEEQKPGKLQDDPCQSQEPPGDYLVVVGPNADQLSKPTVKLSQVKDHRLGWHLRDTKKRLLIAIHRPKTGSPLPPFEDLIEIGTDFWAVPCSGGTCNPGAINKKLPIPKGGQLCYKYDQLLGSGLTTLRADGMIIIQP